MKAIIQHFPESRWTDGTLAEACIRIELATTRRNRVDSPCVWIYLSAKAQEASCE